MRIRTVVAIVGTGLYLSCVAHASLHAQCPARALESCARVHALMTQGRPPTVRMVLATPLRAHAVPGPLRHLVMRAPRRSGAVTG